MQRGNEEEQTGCGDDGDGEGKARRKAVGACTYSPHGRALGRIPGVLTEHVAHMLAAAEAKDLAVGRTDVEDGRRERTSRRRSRVRGGGKDGVEAASWPWRGGQRSRGRGRRPADGSPFAPPSAEEEGLTRRPAVRTRDVVTARRKEARDVQRSQGRQTRGGQMCAG